MQPWGCGEGGGVTGERRCESNNIMAVINCWENIQGKEQRETEGLGFQERHAVISKCFSALSACLTKAAGEFYPRIRLVAFLWLLTSGGFGLR